MNQSTELCDARMRELDRATTPTVKRRWHHKSQVPLRPPAPPLLAALTVPGGAADVLSEVWKRRACFVCGARIWCAHREPEVELAVLQSLARGLREVRQ